MMPYFSVALGGALGTLLRYAIGQWLQPAKSEFPYATLLINVIGSLMIGVLYVILVERSQLDGYWRELLMIGFCGGLTTFSAFSLDAISLWQSGHALTAILYIVLSVIFCIVAAFIAITLTRLV